jgi:hypothetical protein
MIRCRDEGPIRQYADSRHLLAWFRTILAEGKRLGQCDGSARKAAMNK